MDARCYHCGGTLFKELDEDTNKYVDKCLACGRVQEKHAPPPPVISPTPATPRYAGRVKGAHDKAKRATPERSAYLNAHRDEILKDRVLLGHGKAMRKWDIPRSRWQYIAFRWRGKGVEIQDLRGAWCQWEVIHD